jgi:hypothetical protein
MGSNRVVAVRILYGCAKALLTSLAGLTAHGSSGLGQRRAAGNGYGSVMYMFTADQDRGAGIWPRFPLSQTMLEPEVGPELAVKTQAK